MSTKKLTGIHQSCLWIHSDCKLPNVNKVASHEM